jgi:hypothetical protein
MPLIRYWFPSDEELGGALAPVVQEDSSDWWAGAAQCFAGVALAASVAASSLGAQLPYADGWQQDEIPAAPAFALDDRHYLPPVPAAVASQVALGLAFDEQDDYVGTLTVDEDGQWAFRLLAPSAVVLAFAAADDFAAAAFGLQWDDDPGYQPPVPASVRSGVATLADDVFTSLPDDDPGYQPVALPGTRSVAALLDDDLYVPVWVDDDSGYMPSGPVAPPRLVTPILDADAVPISAPLPLADDGWAAAVPTPPGRAPQALTDDDQFVPSTEYSSITAIVTLATRLSAAVAGSPRMCAAVSVVPQLSARVTIYPG